MPAAERECPEKAASLEQLLHREAPGDHALPVHAVDGRVEVAPVFLDAEGIHLGIARRFATLEEQAVDLIGIFHVPFYRHHVVDLNRAVLLAPGLRRRLGIGPTIAASSSPACSMARISFPAGARSTFGGSRNSATCGSSNVTHLMRSRSTPKSSARMPRTQAEVVTEYERRPILFPFNSWGGNGPRSAS